MVSLMAKPRPFEFRKSNHSRRISRIQVPPIGTASQGERGEATATRPERERKCCPIPSVVKLHGVFEYAKTPKSSGSREGGGQGQ